MPCRSPSLLATGLYRISTKTAAAPGRRTCAADRASASRARQRGGTARRYSHAHAGRRRGLEGRAGAISENPFPQWFAPPARAKHQDLQAWMRRVFPRSPTLTRRMPREVLVAVAAPDRRPRGWRCCSRTSTCWRSIWSLASLAYARRKSEELNISNVRYAQADILELNGVWAVRHRGLRRGAASSGRSGRRIAPIGNATRPGRALLIALYSELGRRELRLRATLRPRAAM